MNLEFIKPVYGAVKSVNGMTGDVVIEVPEANLEGYATEEYVAKKIAEAELAEGEVDLSAYYTKSETEAKIDEKIAAIPEPEIPDVDLSDYYNKAEVDAKIEEIELTPGEPGAPGKDGYTPQKGVDYFDGKDGLDGVDGKDYVLTEEDKREIADMVDVEGGGGSAYNVFEDIFFETDVSGSLVIPFDEFLDERMNASVGHNLWVECRTPDDRGWMQNYNIVEVDGMIVFEHLNESTEGLFDATYDIASKSMTVTGDGHIKGFMQVNDSPFYTRLEQDTQFTRREELDWRIDDVMMRLNNDYYERWQIDEMLNEANRGNEAVLCAGEFTEYEIPFEEPQHEMIMNFVNDGVHVNLELVNLADGAGWGYGMTPVEEDGMVIFPVDAESNDGILTSLVYNPATRVLNVGTVLSQYYLRIFIPAEKEYYMKHEADDRFVDNEELQHILEEIGGGAGGSAAVDNMTIVQNGDGTISTAIGGGRVMTAEPVIYVDYHNETGFTCDTSGSTYPRQSWGNDAFEYHSLDTTGATPYELIVRLIDNGNEVILQGMVTVGTNYYNALIQFSQYPSFNTYFSFMNINDGGTFNFGNSKTAYATYQKIYVTDVILQEPATYEYQYVDSNFLNVDTTNSFDIKGGQLQTKLRGIEGLNPEAMVFGFKDTRFDSGAQRTFVFGEGNTITERYYNAAYYKCRDTVVFGDNSYIGVFNGASIGSQNSAAGSKIYMLGTGLSADGFNKLALGTWNEYNRTEPIQFGIGTSSNERLTGMTIDSTGNVVTKGTVSNGGADYAEYFEWVDGNPEAEDRIGYMVTLEGDKIRFAAPGDEILGVISGTAAMIGDDAQWHWSKKYLTDEFGRIQHEYVEIKTEAFDADGNPVEQIEKVKTLKLNPDWDENASYVSRKERKEWDIVGLFGKLYVRDDGTCAVGGYASVGANGVATNSAEKTNMRVMERVNDNIIKVFMK
jgi:hypothetical protein